MNKEHPWKHTWRTFYPTPLTTNYILVKELFSVCSYFWDWSRDVKQRAPAQWGCWRNFLDRLLWRLEGDGEQSSLCVAVYPPAGVLKWWRGLRETFISQIHFIDHGPVRAEAVGGLQGSEWLFSAHAGRPTVPSAPAPPEEVWSSLWWLFYQRSCASPGRLQPEEDDPHSVKAKCSVLISRDEQPLTRVNLLDLGRFIVSCHSWTHHSDLYLAVLVCSAHTHTQKYKYILVEWLACSLTDHGEEKNSETDTLTDKN